MNSPILKTYIVAYDLSDEGGDYGPFYQTMQGVESYARPLNSVWMVRSRMPIADLARALSARLQPDDRLLVVECDGHAAWRALTPANVQWLDKVFASAKPGDRRSNLRVA
ncbi:MAG: hypothetical protein ACREB6_07770 [Rhodospirillales bacterium]